MLFVSWLSKPIPAGKRGKHCTNSNLWVFSLLFTGSTHTHACTHMHFVAKWARPAPKDLNKFEKREDKQENRGAFLCWKKAAFLLRGSWGAKGRMYFMVVLSS